MAASAENPYRAPQLVPDASAHRALLDPPIRTSRVLTSDDIFPLLVTRSPHRFLFAAAYLAIIIVLLTGTALVFWQPHVQLAGLGIILLFASFAPVFHVENYLRLKRACKESVGHFHPQRREFRSDGLHVETEFGERLIPWSAFTSVVASPWYATLRMGVSRSYLARHLFSTDDEWLRLTSFLKLEIRGYGWRRILSAGKNSAPMIADDFLPQPAQAIADTLEDEVTLVDPDAPNTLGEPIPLSDSMTWQESQAAIRAIMSVNTNVGFKGWRWLAKSFSLSMLPGLFMLAFGFWLRPAAVRLAWVLLAVPPLTATFLLLLFVLFPRLKNKCAFRQALRNRTGIFEPITGTLDHQQLKIHSLSGPTEKPWGVFDASQPRYDARQIDGKVILLKSSRKNEFQIIPRSWFQNDADWQRAVAFLRTRFPQQI